MKILQSFKTHLIANGKSKKTIETYLILVKSVLKTIPFEELSTEKVEIFFAGLAEKSKSTRNTYRHALNSFLKFTGKDGDIKLPKTIKINPQIPEIITEEYLREIIANEIDLEFMDALKIKTMIFLMFFSGIRLQEIVNLKREHIDLEHNSAIILGKGDKPREVYFTDEVKNMIIQYFGTETEQTNAFNMSYRTLRARFSRLNKNLNIKFHPHLLRYSFGTQYTENGGNSDVLQELLGHKDHNTTRKYIRFSKKLLKTDYERTMKQKRNK